MSVRDSLADRLVQASVEVALFGKATTPAKVGRWEVVRPLGGGAMGTVYLAKDGEREVALKVLHGGLTSDDEARARMLREGRALQKLAHDNLVQVFEVGEADRRVFIAMELVRGVDLRAWLELAPRSEDEILGVFAQAADALTAAHAAGLVHRDFKLENVLVDQTGRVKVVDFGLARQAFEPGGGAVDPTMGDKLTRTGASVGTPDSMAPEQLEGTGADAKSDQFSLCVALWEALYRRRAFIGQTADELVAAIRTGPLGPVGQVAPHVRAALERGLAYEPERRFADVAALREALVPVAKAGGKVWIVAVAVAVAIAGAAFAAAMLAG